MNWLARIKLWQWLIFALLLTNLTWNFTGYHMVSFWTNSIYGLDIRIFTALVFFIPISVMAYMSWHSKAAVVFTLGLALAVIGVLVNRGWLTSASSAQYWAPSLVAIILTVGFNWKKVWRNLTGQTAVYDDSGEITHT